MTQPAAANGIAANGIAAIPSAHSVRETVARIRAALEVKGVTLFAVINHSGEAAKAGLHMPDTKLLIFGNPEAGTPLMLSAPSAAIDLPLKILVAEDQSGHVSISWNDPSWLQTRHAFDPALVANIAVVEKLATAAAS
jgi:uncharacterized protein (DUF302 family)